MNVAIVDGFVASEPQSRLLKAGNTLVSWEVSTSAPGAGRTVPVVWLDPPDQVAAVAEGARVLVLGSVARRFFRAGGATASRTEVLGERVVTGRGVKRRGALLREATRRLEGAAEAAA